MTYKEQIIAQEKIKLIDYHIIATLFAIFLLYNKKLNILNKKTFLGETDSKIVDFIRVSIVVIVVVFIQYINYQNKEVAIYEKKNITPINLNIASIFFFIIATVLALYSVYTEFGPEPETAPIPLV